MKTAKRVIYAVLALLTLVVIAAIAIPFFIPVSHYKHFIEIRASKALGRKVTINGSLSARLLPFPKISIGEISIANPPGTSTTAFFQIKELSANLYFWPLLQRKIIISSIELDEPRARLEKLSDGSNNWGFPGLDTTTDQEKDPLPVEIQIDTVKLVNGEISYKDESKQFEAKKIDGLVVIKTLSGPFEIDLTASVGGQEATLNASIGPLATEPLKLAIDVKVPDFHAKIAGLLSRKELSFTGNLDATGNPRILQKLKSDLKLNPPFDRDFRLISKVSANAEEVKLTDAKLQIANENIQGHITVQFKNTLTFGGTLSHLPGQGRIEFLVRKEPPGFNGSVDGSFVKSFLFLKWIKINASSFAKALANPLLFSAEFDLARGILIRKLHLSLGRARLEGQVFLPKNTKVPEATVDLKTPDIDALLDVLDISHDGLKGPMTVAGNLSGGIKKMKLNLTGMLGITAITGKGEIDSSKNKTHFNLYLQADTSDFRGSFVAFGRKPVGQFNKASLTSHIIGDSELLTVDANASLDALSIKGKGSIAKLSATPSFNIALSAAHPNIRGLLAGAGKNWDISGGAFQLSTDLSGTAQYIVLDKLSLSAGPHLSIRGKMDIDRRANKTQIITSLRLNPLVWDPAKPKTPGKDQWSKETFSLSFLEDIDGQFDISSPQLVIKKITFANPKLTGKLKDGRLDIAPFAADVFNGEFKLVASLTSKNHISLKASLKNANIKTIVEDATKIKIIDGRLNLSADLAAQGQSPFELIHHLNGTTGFTVTKGTINGLDIDAVAQRIANLKDITSVLSLLQTALSKGKTSFSDCKGNILFKNGVGDIQSMAMITSHAKATATGSIDLPQYQMDVTAQLRLNEFPQFPPIGMKFFGPLDNPTRRLQTQDLQNYMIRHVFRNVVESVISGKGQNLLTPLGASDVFFGRKEAPTEKKSSKPPEKTQPKQRPGFLDLLRQGIEKK